MLGAVSLRLGQEKVRDQFAPAAGAEGVDPESFAGRLAAVASERRLSVERLVNVVLTTPATKEST
jgi:hypothetical protein